jgi:hypothetical protein
MKSVPVVVGCLLFSRRVYSVHAQMLGFDALLAATQPALDLGSAVLE